jgi:PAS domain S-box-containing protein
MFQESEDRYRTLLEDQTEVILRFRVDGTLLFVNDVCRRFFGNSGGELPGCKWQPMAMAEQERARLCHGALEIVGRPGKGTTVCLTVPLKAGQPAQAAVVR